MGNFDVTCSLSNTSISSEEQCLMIVFNDFGYDDIKPEFLILQLQSLLKTKKERLKDIGTFEKMDLDESKKIKLLEYSRFVDPIYDVVIGEYDFEGSIENYKYDRGKKCLFFHLWVIEAVFDESLEEMIKDKEDFVYKILTKMYNLRRIPIFSDNSSCSHPKSENEINDMIKLNTKTIEYLKESYKKLGKFKYNEDSETIETTWICNECGFSDYNLSISELDINSGNLQCSNCGCSEFHLK